MDAERFDALSRTLGHAATRRGVVGVLAGAAGLALGGAAAKRRRQQADAGRVGTARASGKVTLCHRTGNGTYRVITVAESALPAHLDHGDFVHHGCCTDAECGTGGECRNGACGPCAGGFCADDECCAGGTCADGSAWAQCGADGEPCAACAMGEVCTARGACAACADQSGGTACNATFPGPGIINPERQCGHGNGPIIVGCTCVERFGGGGSVCVLPAFGCNPQEPCRSDADCEKFAPGTLTICVLRGDCDRVASCGETVCMEPCPGT